MQNNSTLTQEIDKAAFKAIIQAIVIPAIIFLIMFFVERQYSLVAAVGYLLMPTYVYARSKKLDITKKIFFRILSIYFAMILLFATVVLASAS